MVFRFLESLTPETSQKTAPTEATDATPSTHIPQLNDPPATKPVVNKGAPILPPGNQTLQGQAEHQEQVQEHQSSQQFIDSSIIQQRQSRPKLKLDDFHLLRTLGTGSFGRVHLAQSKVNARFYAIKVLKKTEVVRLKQVEHTNNEKHILEAVAHPFLVNMWGTFQDDANLYMVMDYVPGGELFSVLRKSQVKNKTVNQGMKWGIHFYHSLLINSFFLLGVDNSVSPIMLQNSMLLKSSLLWNTCIQRMSYIEISSPRTYSWMLKVTWKSQILVLPSMYRILHGLSAVLQIILVRKKNSSLLFVGVTWCWHLYLPYCSSRDHSVQRLWQSCRLVEFGYLDFWNVGRVSVVPWNSFYFFLRVLASSNWIESSRVGSGCTADI